MVALTDDLIAQAAELADREALRGCDAVHFSDTVTIGADVSRAPTPHCVRRRSVTAFTWRICSSLDPHPEIIGATDPRFESIGVADVAAASPRRHGAGPTVPIGRRCSFASGRIVVSGDVASFDGGESLLRAGVEALAPDHFWLDAKAQTPED